MEAKLQQRQNTVQRAALWTIMVLVALIFVMTGVSKLSGASSARWSHSFARWGYPAALQYAAGTLEIIGGMGLLVPVATRPAAAALMVVMVGACYTHLSHGEAMRVVPPLVLGTFAFLIFRWRHPLSVKAPPR